MSIIEKISILLNESAALQTVAKRFGYKKKKGTDEYHHPDGHSIVIEKNRWTHHQAGGLGMQIGHSDITLNRHLEKVHEND